VNCTGVFLFPPMWGHFRDGLNKFLFERGVYLL
jgi:hypothetical protein